MKDYNPKAALKTSRAIFIGLLGMPIAFILMVFYTTGSISEFMIDTTDPLQISLIILFLAIFPASIIVPRQYLKKNKIKDGLQYKLGAFQTIFIIKSALWIGVANFGIVAFMMSENLFPLLVAVIAIMIVASYYPNIRNIQKIVNLDPDEVNQLL